MWFFYKYHKKKSPDSPANIREIVIANSKEEAEKKLQRLQKEGMQLCSLLHGPYQNEQDARYRA